MTWRDEDPHLLLVQLRMLQTHEHGRTIVATAALAAARRVLVLWRHDAQPLREALDAGERCLRAVDAIERASLARAAANASRRVDVAARGHVRSASTSAALAVELAALSVCIAHRNAGRQALAAASEARTHQIGPSGYRAECAAQRRDLTNAELMWQE